MKQVLLIIACSVLIFSSCTEELIKEESINFISYSDEEYEELSELLDLPRYFDRYAGGTTLSSASKATLGRVLFYDKSLSEDNSVSCASCHKQELAFSDNKAQSDGIFGRKTDRNSLALGVFSSFADEYGSNGNPGATGLFWDTRAIDVHSQLVETIANEKEMGLTMNELLSKVRGKRHYEILFEKAFDTKKIEDHMVLSALENFMQAMTVDNSKFDRFQHSIRSGNIQSSGATLSLTESRGRSLFAKHCQACHGRQINLITGPVNHLRTMANNGLDAATTDMGRAKVTHLERDEAVFKVPSLRNVALTGPYMHDGRFGTLEEVIDFYSKGIQPHFNLDENLRDRDGNPLKLDFSPEDKKAVVAFLKTLTDVSEINKEKFSDPWLK